MIVGKDFTGIFVATYCHDGKGNFAMVKRSTKSRDSHGYWDFGGGTVEFGQTLDETVIREVCEEFGVEPLSFEQLGSIDLISENKDRHWVGIFYKVFVDRKKVYNAKPDIHEEFGWFTLDDLPSDIRPNIPAQLVKFSQYLN